jgi:cytochrome P450
VFHKKGAARVALRGHSDHPEQRYQLHESLFFCLAPSLSTFTFCGAIAQIRSTPGFPEFTPGGRAAARLGQENPTFVDMDPPQHTLYRAMVEHEFSPDAVAKVRPSAEHAIEELLDRMTIKKNKGESVDFMADFAQPMTAGVICR